MTLHARPTSTPASTTVDTTIAAALAGSAAASAAVPDPEGGAAGLAWRWVVRTDALDLYAADPAAPDWRATRLGAGAALHRARVALAADGLAASVTIEPAVDETGHLARLVTAGRIAVTPRVLALYDATETVTRPPARGRAAWRAISRELVAAARAEGVRLRMVTDAGALRGVLHGADSGEAWLRAGCALSAVRLTARRHGLETVATLGVEPDGSRSPRRRVGDREGWLTVGIGTPYARLHLSPAPSSPPPPPSSSR